MSDLFRALPKIKEKPDNAPRPPPLPLTTSREDDASSSSDSSASTTDSINTLRPSPRSEQHQETLSAIAWSDYYQQELYLEESTPTQEAIYHVYLTAPADLTKGPLFITHHGAGATGMSFAMFARQIKHLQPAAGILSLEAREHGSVVTSSTTDTFGQEILDFSIGTLVADALSMIRMVQSRMGWAQLPPSVFVGHSLGGAVATHIAASGALGARLVGFQVLDVVEGSALEALAHMRMILAGRPPSFASVDAAIEWHVRSRTIRDAESAKASVPSLLVRAEDGRWKWKTDLRRTED